VTLCVSDGSNRGADWGTDDMIVFSPHYTEPLLRVSGAGGSPAPLTTIDKSAGERTHRWPQAVAGEDLVLFTVGTLDSPESYDDARIQAIRPASGEQRTVLERASMARYVPSGHLVFGREGFLFAVPFDVKTLETRGSPVPVMQDVMGMRSSGVVHAAFSSNGLLAYVAGTPRSRSSRLVWRGRDGSRELIEAPVAGYVNPRLSPDGKRVAAQVEGAATFDVWTYLFEQQTLTRLTFEGDNLFPAWSRDGKRLAFASVRNNALMSAYVKAADGSGVAERILDADAVGAGQVMPREWVPAGDDLLMTFTNENGANVMVLPDHGGEPRVVLETPANEGSPAVSPNGRWMAYTSDEAGDFQVFVRAFPGPGGKWQISTTGGVQPRWSPDGKELFYRSSTSLFAVQVLENGGGFRAGRPVELLDDLSGTTSDYDYDVLDSGRFLFVETVGQDEAPAGVTVVTDWFDELRRKLPR
jgi:serine/threonine-protein kinase